MLYIYKLIKKETLEERLVCNSMNSHTSTLSKFVEHYLKPVQNLPSYVKYTTNFIKNIRETCKKTQIQYEYLWMRNLCVLIFLTMKVKKQSKKN